MPFLVKVCNINVISMTKMYSETTPQNSNFEKDFLWHALINTHISIYMTVIWSYGLMSYAPFLQYLTKMTKKWQKMTYEICHMTVIDMLIWVLNEASGSQECSPAFETRSKNYFQWKKGKYLATSFFLCILKNFLCIFKSAGTRSI